MAKVLQFQRLEALVPSHDSRARTRSPSPRAWRPDFPDKVESKLPREISITSDMQITLPLWQKVKTRGSASWLSSHGRGLERGEAESGGTSRDPFCDRQFGELRECANRRQNTWFPAPRSPSSLPVFSMSFSFLSTFPCFLGRFTVLAEPVLP